MNRFSIESQGLLPGVILDRDNGEFQIYGKSCPSDAFEFYDPIFDWLDEYSSNPLKNTVFDLKLTYFNTVSAKFLLRLMTKLEDLNVSGNDVKIRWFYDECDDDLEEAGEEFENIVDIDFELVPMKDCNSENDKDQFFDDLMDDIT
jgi:hypothetical protein